MKTKLILTAALLIAVFSGCKKEKYLAASFGVSNTTETVYTTAARLEATFSYPGTKYVIRVDVSERQDMSEAVHYDVKVNGDKLTAYVTGLKANTTYYYRYSNDTGFGILSSEQKSFKTNDYSVPAVTTAEVSEITVFSAKCGGEVTDDGYLEVTARGVCWSTSQNPTVSDSHTTDGSGTGSFTSSITGLTEHTTYYVRAYATNSKGTSYGEQKSFTTDNSVPTVTTASVSNITQTIATCGGNVTSDGGAAVTARGVCWSTSPNPTVSDSHTTDGSGTGSFTSSITGLTASTTYYVRAYATNSKGTSYGEQKSFTTLSILVPTVTTAQVSNITQIIATCGGNVTSDGGAAETARGVCWSASQNPTVSDSHTTDGSGTGSFTSSITGLTASTTYYVRAYATNSAGTSYGEQKSFTTQSGGGGDHEYVDLGLPSGLLWATCNVGADKPEDYGYHFAWGETTTKSTYDWSTYKWCNGSANTLTKYCTYSSFGTVDHKMVLDPEDDAAHANWGGGWRMPTNEEWRELYDNTTSTWTTEDGVYGRKFTSKTDSSKYIFLPAAGIREGASLNHAGSYGFYWSSVLVNGLPNHAYLLCCASGDVNQQYYYDRCLGLTVRPVR